MVSPSSILAHVALQFAKHPENLATEGLAFILKRSETAAAALLQLLGQLCADTGQQRLTFTTQDTNEAGGRPDLIGSDSQGRIRLYLEAKFWAALTDRQPVAYLDQLEAPAVLLFVAPERRLTLVWQELEGRLSAAEREFAPIEGCPTQAVRAGGKTLALISWRTLLDRLHAALEASGDLATASDVRQLSALCDRMDSEAFVPLSLDDLNPTLGKRVLNYCQLVDDVTTLLVGAGHSDITSLRATNGRGSYGRYQVMGRVGAFLHFSPDAWAEWGHSPIWVTVKTATSSKWELNRQFPSTLRLNGIYCEDDADGCHIPLPLRRGIEWDDLKALIAEKCRQISALLNSGS